MRFLSLLEEIILEIKLLYKGSEKIDMEKPYKGHTIRQVSYGSIENIPIFVISRNVGTRKLKFLYGIIHRIIS